MQTQVRSPIESHDQVRFVESLELIKQQTKPAVFESWFHKLELLGVDETSIKIGTQNPYVKLWIEDPEGDLLPILTRAIAQAFGRPLKPELVIATRASETPAPASGSALAPSPALAAGSLVPTAPPPASIAPTAERRPIEKSKKPTLEPDSSIQLKDEYAFDTYVVGPSNRFAHAAAHAVVKDPGRDYNPLFIHSNVGLGKTHLLQAICHELIQREPRPRILYLSCEEFVNRFVTALHDRTLEAFRTKHRSVDVLVIDDIHFLADKPQIQEEFFHTFNALDNAQRQIILSSDSHPSEIPTLEERLVSRFTKGLVAKIDTPPLETRMAIIKKKATSRGQNLDDDVVELLAQRIDSNIREIEGALNRLIGTASLTNTTIDRAFTQQVLRDLLGEENATVHLHDIAEVVCTKLKVKLTELQSKRRIKNVAFARHVAMYLARSLTAHTLSEIGSHFGGKDHTTVLYAVEKIGDLVEKSPDTKVLVEELKREARCRKATGR